MGTRMRVVHAAKELGLTPSAISIMISRGRVTRASDMTVDLDEIRAATFNGKLDELRHAYPDADFKTRTDLTEIFKLSHSHITAMLRRIGPHRYYVDDRRFLVDFNELLIKLERSRRYHHYVYYGRDYVCNVWFKRD